MGQPIHVWAMLFEIVTLPLPITLVLDIQNWGGGGGQTFKNGTDFNKTFYNGTDLDTLVLAVSKSTLTILVKSFRQKLVWGNI